MLTRDYQRLVTQRTRLLNHGVATLKEHYPRPLICLLILVLRRLWILLLQIPYA